MRANTRALRVLDFDIENRPLSYWYNGECTAEVTAIAWSWLDEEVVYVHALDPPPEHEKSLVNMLVAFVKAYDQADVVTGHYIRKHDLPILNGACLEVGLPVLKSKLTSDTKLDGVKAGALSMSQESLDDMLRHADDKHHMTQARWRKANRLSPDGIAETVKRVHADVVQHKLMRAAMLERGLLKSPTIWRP
jgi:hypothetical protein